MLLAENRIDDVINPAALPISVLAKFEEVGFTESLPGSVSVDGGSGLALVVVSGFPDFLPLFFPDFDMLLGFGCLLFSSSLLFLFFLRSFLMSTVEILFTCCCCCF